MINGHGKNIDDYKLMKIIFFILLFLPLAAFSGVENREKIWLGLDVENQLKPNSKWHYDFFIQPRFASNQVILEQTIIRPALFYQYNDNWSYWLGYDFNPTIPRNTREINLEQRLWSQIEYDTQLGNQLKLSSRSRYEIRGYSQSDEMATRFRQRFEATIVGQNKFNISYDIFYEGFFRGKNADWVSNERVDQNRFYFGLEIPANKIMQFNVGYLNIFRPRNPVNRIDNILALGLSINLEKSEAGPVRTL